MLVLLAAVIGLVAGVVAYGRLFRAASFSRRLTYAVAVGLATPVFLFVLVSALVAISFWVESRR